MKKTLTIIGFRKALPTEVALPGECGFAPLAAWQPREADARWTKENCRTTRRIKVDKGCCLINGSAAERHRSDVKVHPATLHLIEFEFEYEGKGKGVDRLRRDREGRRDD